MDTNPAPDVAGIDTTSADSIPRDIYHVTNACVRSLEECLSLPELMDGAWAENRLADFNLWAAGVGASTTSRVSLDWRLRFQPEVRIVLTSLLVTLKNFTDECKDIARRSGHGGSGKYSPVDDKGGFWSQEDPESEGAPSEAASWFDALDSDPGDEGPFGATTIPSDPGGKTSSGPLSEAMKHTQDVLNQLIRLGYAIRKSGTNSRLRRADSSFRQGDHKAFQNYLSLILRVEMSSERHGPHTTANQRVKEDQDSYDQLTPEQRQLVFANLRRRHRFLYARRHQQKLDNMPRQSSIVPEVKPVYPRDETGRTVAPSQAPQSVVVKHSRLEHRVNESREPDGSGMTTTAASGVDGNILGGAAEISQAASRVSATAAKLSYPSPPPGTPGMISFKCPCCCQTLPDMFRSRSRWRKHLSEDLCPYTCPFSDYQDTGTLYHNRATWKAHINERHCTSQWECLLCTGMGKYVAFYTASQFGNHMREHHQTTVSETQIEGLHELCRRLVPPHLPSCPLCSTGQQDWNRLDPEGRIDHLGDCIHEFSLRALPWAQSLPERTPLRVPEVDEKVSAWFDTIDGVDMEGDDQGPRFLPFPDDVPVSDEIYLASEYFAASSKGTSRAGDGSASWDLVDHSQAGSFHTATSGQGSSQSNQPDASELDTLPPGHGTETKAQKGKAKAVYEDLDQDENDFDPSSLPLQPYNTSTTNISNPDPSSFWGDWVSPGEIDPTTSASIYKAISKRVGVHSTPPEDQFETSQDAITGEEENMVGSFEDPSNSMELGGNRDSRPGDHDSGDAHIVPDPRYRLVPPHKFQPGVVFKLSWPTPISMSYPFEESSTGSTKEGVPGGYWCSVFVGIRTFVVVAQDADHSTCLYITTYGGQGCKAKGVKAEKHGMIVQNGTKMKRLDGEPKLGFPPVRMIIDVEGETLSSKSRIDYSKLVTVEHDTNVFLIGSIHNDDYDLIVDAVSSCWERKAFRRSRR